MNFDTKVTLQLPVREMCRLYAVMGGVNGNVTWATSAWHAAKQLLDPGQKKYNEFFKVGSKWYEPNRRQDYAAYRREWEQLLLADHTRIKELRDQIKKATEELRELEDVVNGYTQSE